MLRTLSARIFSPSCWTRLYSVNGNEVKRGMLVSYKGGLCRVVESRSVKPGKGGAFQQVELRDIETGKKRQERFRASEKVEIKRLDKEETYQVLYRERDGYFVLMHAKTYEQIDVPEHRVGDPGHHFLKDGIEVGVELFEGKPMFLQMPKKVPFVVERTNAPGKDSSRNTDIYKDADLVGATKSVLVPQFIDTGDIVFIDPINGEYRGRQKK
eukprot:GSMAST32.ASY1.ANO1.518.1 assembled CDS